MFENFTVIDWIEVYLVAGFIIALIYFAMDHARFKNTRKHIYMYPMNDTLTFGIMLLFGWLLFFTTITGMIGTMVIYHIAGLFTGASYKKDDK